MESSISCESLCSHTPSIRHLNTYSITSITLQASAYSIAKNIETEAIVVCTQWHPQRVVAMHGRRKRRRERSRKMWLDNIKDGTRLSVDDLLVLTQEQDIMLNGGG